MKRISVAIIFFLISSMCYIQFNVYKNFCVQKESEKILKKAYTIIENSKESNYNNQIVEGKLVQQVSNNTISNNEETQINQVVIGEDGIIGILSIPILNIEAPIREGTTQEIMKTSIGHFIESDYWNGNVSFASHNGGINAHYFEKIHLLKENDEIKYMNKLGTKTYKVQQIKKIKSTDWSMVVGKYTEDNTIENVNENTITLITCINGLENYRLCVRGIEIKEI